MKVLTHNIIKTLEENQIAHLVHFEFVGKEFCAYVLEDLETTYVDRCYTLQDEDIDIPTYFGTGFSSQIYSLIYNQVDKRE
jgi:hypothetical protein